MKKAIIIHCWDGDPEYCWYPYVRHQLEIRGFEVKVPFFPEALPLLGEWLIKIKKVINSPDKNTFLIGHSLGGIAILKYLQALPPDQKVGGVVLVATFTDNMGFLPLANFFTKPLDYQAIKQHTKNFIVIASDNDPYVKFKHASILQRCLDAEVIWKHQEHFTETRNKIQCLELPEVVLAVEKLSALAENQSQPVSQDVNQMRKKLNFIITKPVFQG